MDIPTVDMKGQTVFASPYNGKLVPVVYANLSQARKKAEKLGEGWDVWQSPLSRRFFVVKASTTHEAKERAMSKAKVSKMLSRIAGRLVEAADDKDIQQFKYALHNLFTAGYNTKLYGFMRDNAEVKDFIGRVQALAKEGNGILERLQSETPYKEQWGFDLTGFPLGSWKKLISRLGLKLEHQGGGEYGNSFWVGNGLEIVTEHNPMDDIRGDTEFAGYIGIEGAKSKVLEAVRLIKSLTDNIKGESPHKRSFI